MKRGLFISLLFVILILNFASATFEIGNVSYSLDSKYSSSEDVRGWINISFNEETSNSVFLDSYGNSINLIDLLTKNLAYDYSCTTNNCSADYSATNGSSTKSFNLGVGKTKTIGLKFDKYLTEITSINFLVESDADQSCYNQLTLDFLVDGTVDFANNKSMGESCSFLKSYGCFVEGPTDEAIIEKFPSKQCQKIIFSESPGFKIGAWIKRNGDMREITAEIYDLYGGPIEGASCILPNISEGEVSCEVDYTVLESQEYYVCIYSEENGNSTIRGYEDIVDGCGFSGVGVLNENAAFQIFSEGKKFDDVGVLSITNSLPHGNALNVYAQDYIIEKYGDLDCSTGCVVPLKLSSQREQNLLLKNLEVVYKSTLGSTTTNKFYDVGTTSPKVTSDFQKLSLDKGGFTLPSKYEQTLFKLDFNGEEILSEYLTIEAGPTIKYLTPTKTASAYPTKFEVKTNGTATNIASYKWEFGDNQSQTTSVDNVVHTYLTTGVYPLKITITDSLQKSSSQTFQIIVESPQKMINATLKKLQNDLNNVNKQVAELPLFHQESLEEILKLESMSDKLKQAQKDYNSAVSEGDFNSLMADVLEIKIPESVTSIKTSEPISFYPEPKNINLDVLAAIGGGNYKVENKEELTNGVFAWHQENIESKITFMELSAKYEDYDEPLLRVFDINVKKTNSEVRDPYIILGKLENLRFKENYLEAEESGYVYISLTQNEKTISFSTTEEVDFVSLPLFISPEIDRLPLIQIVEGDDGSMKWKLFVAVIIFLLVMGLILYIILQEWYKRKYENYLFKNRNELYNLVNFIQNSRNKKIEDSKIASKLRAAGWKFEQVTYAMKKYSGKRTGMFEIPVDKLLNLFKKKQPQELLPKRDFVRRPPMR